MGKNNEPKCWDCPSRRGLSWLVGRVAFRFWSEVDPTGDKIKEQRQGCQGKVYGCYMSEGSGRITLGDDVVVHEFVSHDVYLNACSRAYNEPPETPVEVKTAMRVNNLDVFVHETIQTRQESREAYDANAARVLGAFRELQAKNRAAEA